MKKNIIRTMAALLMASATTFTACSSSDDILTDEPQQPAGPKTYTLTVEASKGGDAATTRALSLSADGMTLNPTWKKGEEVDVSNNNPSRQGLLGTLTAQSDGATTTLTGTLTGTIEAGDELYLGIVRDGSWTAQQGTLAYISDHFDRASCNVHVATVDASNNITLTEGSADFDNTIAVVRFHLKDKSGAPLNASALAINIPAENLWDTSDYTLSGMTAATYAANAYEGNDGAGIVYAAIGGCDSKTVTLTATVGDNTYTYSKSGVTFEDGQFYDITVKMQPSTPLTMEALTAGSIVVKNPRSGMQYSLNGGEKITMSGNTAIRDLQVGDKVQFYGKRDSITTYYSSSSDYTSIAGGSAEVKVYGNIMSLVDETGYPTNTKLTENSAFCRLFSKGIMDANNKLKDASGLLLPATTLTEGCYAGMFNYCTALTAAPETLPAKTLANYCYNAMFQKCSKLTTAPALPATTLAEYCYFTMFNSCSSLTAAPELPATTLADYCYEEMFYNCISLTTAPALPATTLASHCYDSMFFQCTSLNSVTCLATDISAKGCTTNWLEGAGKNAEGTKTFTAANANVNWPTGSNGIPDGWTRVNAE